MSPVSRNRSDRLFAFTLLELLVVIALIAVLASMLLPAVGRTRERAMSVQCVGNVRQLAIAWILYSDDNNGRLANNLAGTTGGKSLAAKTNANWVNNNLTWDLDADNTNTAGLTEASLGDYASRNAKIYRCPTDRLLSDRQQASGWSSRVRSYSMNAMVGDAGEATVTGKNRFNPKQSQSFRITEIQRPSETFVFVEEHADSIGDGSFLNVYGKNQWNDLPASRHSGAASLAFADGHAQLHRWESSSTRQPSKAGALNFPLLLSPHDTADLNWVIDRAGAKISRLGDY
jgi:prepilin-type N-terminal cleavage/methylation domain-containing protein/prepilin-type processing-associated H-X9-DG protein